MRNDVHAPASADFDPALYTCHGVFDTHPEESTPAERQNRARITGELRAQGFRFAAHTEGRHVCGHCGHALRYVALMSREDVNELIFVGEDCLDNRFEDLTKGEFQALREAAKLNRERTAKQAKIDAAIEADPILGELLAAMDAGELSGFLADIAWKFRQYGDLSPRQIAAAERAYRQQVERKAAQAQRQAEEEAAKAAGNVEQVPSGRLVVTGEILSSQWRDNGFGGALKMLVRDDRGFKVWGTQPSTVSGLDKGARVTFTATLEPSGDDAYFGFATRPSKAAAAV